MRPSRLRILTEFRHGPCAVTALAAAVEMEQSAVSHQLRLLRAMGLVTGARAGRSVTYRLYDNHVAMLLDEAIYHIEHRGLTRPEPPWTGWRPGLGHLRLGDDVPTVALFVFDGRLVVDRGVQSGGVEPVDP